MSPRRAAPAPRAAGWAGAATLAGAAVLLLLPATGAAAPAGGPGQLEVVSNTADAELFVDGATAGRVPLAAPLRLEAGPHAIKLVKAGYTDYVDVAMVEAGRTVRLEIDLLPVAAVLRARADVAGARLFVDGRYAGVTPLELEVEPGRRALRFARAGYRDAFDAVDAVVGQVYAVRGHLEQLPIGSSPYWPAPLPEPRWYQRGWIWGVGAAGAAALAAAIVVPVLLLRGDAVDDFGADRVYRVP